MLVHCSAGIGRTGTFIAAYATVTGIAYVDAKRPKLDVCAIVARMRQARSGMVSCEKQYRFLYNTALLAVDDFARSAVFSRPR
jgi:protein tyrosine phosphatase